MLLNEDKDSSVVMNRIDYNNIMQKMIDDGIKNKIYEEIADKIFRSFCMETLKIMKIMKI